MDSCYAPIDDVDPGQDAAALGGAPQAQDEYQQAPVVANGGDGGEVSMPQPQTQQQPPSAAAATKSSGPRIEAWHIILAIVLILLLLYVMYRVMDQPAETGTGTSASGGKGAAVSAVPELVAA